MYHMKKASVRDLRYHFQEVEELLREGEDIEITKRRRVVARLSPAKPKKSVEWPDFLSRLNKLYDRKLVKPSGAEQLARERERF
jgi:antitoxin (DNA-binding transcriptional repressor) of toxin-antitoxin stability system